MDLADQGRLFLGDVLWQRVTRFAEREQVGIVTALRRLVDEGLRPYGTRDCLYLDDPIIETADTQLFMGCPD